VSSLQLFGGVALALTFLIARAPWVNLSAIGAAVPAIALYLVLATRTSADTRSVVEARVRSASKVTEGLRSLSSIQATGGARELNRMLRASAEDMRARETRIFFNQGTLQYAMALVPISAAVGAYLYARFGAGASTAQQFAAILMPTAVVGGRVVAATSGIVMNAYSTSVFATSFVPVFGLLDRLTALSRKDRQEGLPAERIGEVVKAVHVKQCSFQLPNGVWLFRELSLSLASGHPLVVRGASGTGKSTLASLIAGTNEPTEGTIAYEFADGGQSPPTPTHLNYLSQDPAVVAGTVRENLLLGMPSAQVEDSALQDALARVRLWDEFAAAGGLNAPVFEGGRNLSGGQIRRLGLARLVLRRKGLWIFDEATASLDPVSREIVETFIREVARREIVVAITHDEGFQLAGAEIHLASNSSARLVGAA
jgi:ABC-type transport system involved in cytochrome bd biosynthesis fused ATPase/permease subunit